jgi:hypothetical protein
VLAVVALGIVLVLGYATMLLDRSAVDFVLEEDGLIEWLGTLGLLTASIAFFITFLRSRPAGDRVLKRIVLLLLALIFLFGAGEEISWGQRLLGLSTPEAIEEANSQDELTIHNLDWFGEHGLFKLNRLFQVLWVVIGVIVPVACAVSARARGWLGARLPILPLWIAGLLVANQILAEVIEAFLEANPELYNGLQISLSQGRIEVTESLTSILLGVGALAVMRETSWRAAAADGARANGTDRSASAGGPTERFAEP